MQLSISEKKSILTSPKLFEFHKKLENLSQRACTKTRNTGTRRNTGTPEHPGTPEKPGTPEHRNTPKHRNTEHPRNTKSDGVKSKM